MPVFMFFTSWFDILPMWFCFFHIIYRIAGNVDSFLVCESCLVRDGPRENKNEKNGSDQTKLSKRGLHFALFSGIICANEKKKFFRLIVFYVQNFLSFLFFKEGSIFLR